MFLFNQPYHSLENLPRSQEIIASMENLFKKVTNFGKYIESALPKREKSCDGLRKLPATLGSGKIVLKSNNLVSGLRGPICGLLRISLHVERRSVFKTGLSALLVDKVVLVCQDWGKKAIGLQKINPHIDFGASNVRNRDKISNEKQSFSISRKCRFCAPV